MRLKKAEREKYLNTVKAYKGQKIIPIEKDKSFEYAMYMLSEEHFSKLTTDLQHIVKFSSTDLTEEYVREYSDEMIDFLSFLVVDTDKSLHHLSDIVIKECNRRAKEKERLVNRLKTKMQKEQTKGTN